MNTIRSLFSGVRCGWGRKSISCNVRITGRTPQTTVDLQHYVVFVFDLLVARELSHGSWMGGNSLRHNNMSLSERRPVRKLSLRLNTRYLDPAPPLSQLPRPPPQLHPEVWINSTYPGGSNENQ